MLRLTFVRDELSTKMFKFAKILVKIVKFQIQKLRMCWSYIILYMFWLVLFWIRLLFFVEISKTIVNIEFHEMRNMQKLLKRQVDINQLLHKNNKEGHRRPSLSTISPI